MQCSWVDGLSQVYYLYKGWVSKRCAKECAFFSETCLALKSNKEDWLNVRFPDEVHRVECQGEM